MHKGKSGTPIILIQAASRAWSGAPDWCMNEVKGRPVVALTVERAFEVFPDADIRIIAPAFDEGGRLDDIPSMFPDKEIKIFYGFDDSPLDRMIAALSGMPDETLIIRVDGFHFGWLPEHGAHMLNIAKQENLDCMKLPDDYPVQLTSDIYRLRALKKASAMLEKSNDPGPYKVHPKFFMTFNQKHFNCAHYTDPPLIDDDYLKKCRAIAKDIYITSRTRVTGKRISGGDQFSFHYKLGLDYISSQMDVLDIACGWGYGSRMLAEKASTVTAADLDEETILASANKDLPDNMNFQIADVTDMIFKNESFDTVTSFETVEHVDPLPYFREMHRVLRNGGLLILSTPQNSLGHIPVNSQHLREFSIKEITTLASKYFTVQKIIGIKQGRVIFPDDPKGQNTFMVCKKTE